MNTKPSCDACKGSGVIAHEPRKIDGKADPWDFQKVELCATCGGSGAKPEVPRRVVREEAKPASG